MPSFSRYLSHLLLLANTVAASASVSSTSSSSSTSNANNSRTTVAVLEFGNVGSVHPSTTGAQSSSATTSTTTVSGVESFWANLHNLRPRRYIQRQEPGMALVPDIFHQPDGGIVIGLLGNGMEFSSMETVSSLLKNKNEDDYDSSDDDFGLVGHLELDGNKVENLMKKTQIRENVIDFGAALQTSAEKVLSSSSSPSNNHASKFQTVAVQLDENKSESSDLVDKQIAETLQSLKKVAEDTESTIVVHVVMEAPTSHYISRKLEDRENEDRDEEDRDNEDRDNEEQGEDGQDGGNLYYGYGYYLDNGEYYTPYRTIFQIQYFNCVVWAVVGLIGILLFSVSLTINMPLMPDTFLFGESAKMMMD